MSVEEDREGMPLVEFHSLYEDLRMDFDPYNKPAQVFHLITFLKKLFIIHFMRWVDNGNAQLSVLLCLQIFYTVYMFRLSPYK